MNLWICGTVMVIFILIIYLYSIYTRNIEHFDLVRNASPFINFNLTEKPIANYAPYPVYINWKYPKLLTQSNLNF